MLVAYIVFGALTFVWVLAAKRLAADQGGHPLRWMIAAATLGPLPLIPLALLRKSPRPKDPARPNRSQSLNHAIVNLNRDKAALL